VESSGEPEAGPDALVGRSPTMQAVFRRIALVAPTQACVLVTGESGTGKELVARAVHAHSPRRDKPFLPVHVAALNPNLVESELFGHVKGAFTGAERSRPGLLALADGGTVFLDELADIPLPVQAKLLRVLERQEITPVGGAQATPVDVRIVSATHADLSAAVRDGRFRHDLFFRLHVYPIHLPPLRDRADDVALLADHFLRRFGVANAAAALPADTLAFLKNRPWPGNVRELRNALEHAAIEARGGPLRPEHFPAPTEAVAGGGGADRLRSMVTEWTRDQARAADGAEPAELYQELLDAVEPALLDEVLRQLGGNRLAAARWLGLARATVRKMIRKYHPAADEPDADEA
jgi:two-component system nitrogen regulation response regulator GlnG